MGSHAETVRKRWRATGMVWSVILREGGPDSPSKGCLWEEHWAAGVRTWAIGVGERGLLRRLAGVPSGMYLW